MNSVKDNLWKARNLLVFKKYKGLYKIVIKSTMYTVQDYVIRDAMYKDKKETSNWWKLPNGVPVKSF